MREQKIERKEREKYINNMSLRKHILKLITFYEAFMKE